MLCSRETALCLKECDHPPYLLGMSELVVFTENGPCFSNSLFQESLFIHSEFSGMNPAFTREVRRNISHKAMADAWN